MATLQEIQQENRRLILEAIHGCSYEKALEKELGFGCEVIVRIWSNPQRITIDNLTSFFDGDYLRFRELVGDISKKDLTDDGLERLEEAESTKHRITQIIGKPITLSRVLLALKHRQIGFYDGSLIEVIETNGYYKEDYNNPICDWDLTKKNLEEQSEETQRAINQLLKNENKS
jgi:hypothetical protein